VHVEWHHAEGRARPQGWVRFSQLAAPTIPTVQINFNLPNTGREGAVGRAGPRKGFDESAQITHHLERHGAPTSERYPAG
jgi:hypothetical protein